MGGQHAKLKYCGAPKCGKPLVYPEGHEKAGQPRPAGTKSCNATCRQNRHEHQKRERKKAGEKTKHAPAVQPMAAVTRGELKDVTHEVMKEELRPLVREAMTADVLQGINMLVGLTREAIAALQQDLSSEDEVIRQRAYTLLLKYTMGNPSVAPPPTQQAPAPMSVTFNIPRPGDTIAGSSTPEELPPGDAEELRQCTDCSEHKPEGEFVGASPRCQECFDGLHATLRERFAVTDETAPDA